MNGYLTAAVFGTALGLVILFNNHGGFSGDGWSPRDIVGGMLEVGFYALLFVGVLAIKRRISSD